MEMSIIIPTYNESKIIGRTIKEISERLSGAVETEIIVSDGGSTDNTRGLAEEKGAVVVQSTVKGRGVQMNYGAKRSRGGVLYFLHADSIPPPGFDCEIMSRVEQGTTAGCFRLQFDSEHPLLNLYAWFTRFDLNAFRFGDQSLFVTRDHFRESGAFLEDLTIMEDNEIIWRLKDTGPFTIIPKTIVTSSRKYRENGVIRLQLVFTAIYLLYHLGLSQRVLVDIYKRFIRE